MRKIISLVFVSLLVACATTSNAPRQTTQTNGDSARPLSPEEVTLFQARQARLRGLQHAAFEASDVVLIDVPEDCRGWWTIGWNIMPPRDGSLSEDSRFQLGGRCTVTNSVSTCAFIVPPSHQELYFHVSVTDLSLPDQPYTCRLRVRRGNGSIVEYRPGRHDAYYTPMIPTATSTDSGTQANRQ